MKSLALSISLILIFLTAPEYAWGDSEVCLTNSEAINVTALLDASARDIELLGTCETLAKDLYTQLDSRDKQVRSLTDDLIEAKHDVIKYKSSSDSWRNVSFVSTGITILIILSGLL